MKVTMALCEAAEAGPAPWGLLGNTLHNSALGHVEVSTVPCLLCCAVLAGASTVWHGW